MSLQNDELSRDLLHSQAHIWNHTFSYVNSMSLKCAIELQIPDIIDRHGAPMLLSELVEALSINKQRTQNLYRLMRILVHSGFFVKQSICTSGENGDEEETEGYLLAPASRLLLKEEPLSIRPFLLGMLDPLLMGSWHHMSKWFRNDDPTTFYTAHGRMFWESAGQDSSHNQFFNEAMACDAKLVTSIILRHYGDGFEKLNSIVDVGGGTGSVAKAIAEAFPNVSCINFDLPHVVKGLEGSKNLSYVSGDMFESIPKADAVLLKNDELSRDLLHSQAHIWNHTFSYVNSMSLKCAIELQIPDIINRHGAPMLLSELVEALAINKQRTQNLYRLMRILVHSGFFLKQSIPTARTEEEREGYLLAPASRLLLKEEPLSIRPFVLGTLDPLLMDSWHHMSKWFKNDDPTPFYTAHGRMFWESAGQDSNHNQFFNEAMASDAKLVTSIILRHCGDAFEKLNSIVDVGGGTGTFAKAIAEAFPNVSCISFDLPHVVNGLEGSKNMSYVAGDMFEAIPNADAVLLKWILHDWNDEECIKILKRCKEAIPSKEHEGKLIIIDIVLKNDRVGEKSLESQLFYDMVMMVDQTGMERSEKEWAKLFLNANFSDYKIIPILGLRSIIEVYP